jgi:hypothetical protein
MVYRCNSREILRRRNDRAKAQKEKEEQEAKEREEERLKEEARQERREARKKLLDTANVDVKGALTSANSGGGLTATPRPRNRARSFGGL